MEGVFVVLFAVVAIAASLWWRSRLLHMIRDREVLTTLPSEEVRRLFVETVATWSWNIQDSGEPLVARSSLLTGFARQRIGLTTATDGEWTYARVTVVSYEGQWYGWPQSAYSLSWRIESFLSALFATDPAAREVETPA